MTVRLAMLTALLVLPLGTTAQGAGWSRPHTLSSTDLGEPAPRVAVGPHGQVAVAWHRRDRELRVALGTSRGRFAGSRVLSRRGLRPRVAFGPRGAAIAVWHERGLKFARRAPGEPRFGRARTLTDPRGQATDDFPRITIDSTGRATVLFEHSYRAGGRFTVVVQSVDVSARGTVGRVVSLGHGSFPRRGGLAQTSRGETLVVFRPAGEPRPVPDPSPTYELVLASRVGTGPWIKQTVTSERELDYPDVAVNRAGRFTFSFTRTERGGEAASFGPPLVSSGPLTGPFGPARGPAVNPRYAFNPWAVPVTGGSVLVWQEKTRARAFSTFAPVRAVRVGLDGSVGRTRVLDSSERGFEPHVVSLDSSRALILWNNPSFAAALYQAGRGFNRVAAPRATPTLGGTDFLFNRDLASNGRGVAAATWTQGTRVRISVRRF